MNILTILCLLINEHGISFYLLVPSSISFISVLWFSVYRSFTSLVKFIPKYFNFCSYCEWDCFLNFFFLAGSLSIHKNATAFVCWFCNFTEFISSNRFFDRTFRFFYAWNHVICKHGLLNIFLSKLNAPLVCFSCAIALAKTSSTM
jgi:hypothetical protein